MAAGRVAPQSSMLRRAYGYLNVAWDEIQLGDFQAASAALQQATAQGANPVIVGWLGQAMAG